MEKPSKHEEKIARQFVDNRKDGNKLGHNTKLTEEGYIQARLGATLRVVFTAGKEIIAIFKKGNHRSHR